MDDDDHDVNYVLIEFVRQRPVLYDKNHVESKNLRLKEKLWASAGDITGLSAMQARKRWCCIRDNFIRFQKRKMEECQAGGGDQTDICYPGLYKQMVWYKKYWRRRPRTNGYYPSSEIKIDPSKTPNLCETELLLKFGDEEDAPLHKVARVCAVARTTGVAIMPRSSRDGGQREAPAAVGVPGSSPGVAATGRCCNSRHPVVTSFVESGCSTDSSAIQSPFITPVSQFVTPVTQFVTPASQHYSPDMANKTRESMETAFVTGMNVLGELSKRLLKPDPPPEQARRKAFINLLEEQVKQVDVKYLNELQLDMLTLVQSFIDRN